MQQRGPSEKVLSFNFSRVNTHFNPIIQNLNNNRRGSVLVNDAH